MLNVGAVGSGSGTVQVSITGVPAGASIGVLVAQTGNGDRTYTASSNQGGGAFTAQRSYAAAVPRTVAVLWLHNAVAGDHTIDVAATTGTVNIHALPFYATDVDTAAAAIVSTFVNTPAGRTHYGAAVGSIDTTTAAHVLCAFAMSSAIDTAAFTAGSGYTGSQGVGGNSAVYFQYKEAASALTDDRGAWSYTGGSARETSGIVVALPKGTPTAPPATVAVTGGGWFGL